MVNTPVILLSDAGPLITLAYADALDVLLLPGWSVQMVDTVSYTHLVVYKRQVQRSSRSGHGCDIVYILSQFYYYVYVYDVMIGVFLQFLSYQLHW